MKEVKSYLIAGLDEARFVKSSETVLVIPQGFTEYTDRDTGENQTLLQAIELNSDGTEVKGGCLIGFSFIVNRFLRLDMEKAKKYAFEISPDGVKDLGKGKKMNTFHIKPFLLEPSDLEALGMSENSTPALPEPDSDPELPAVHPEREKVNSRSAGVDPDEDTIF